MEIEKKSEWWIFAILENVVLRQGQLEYLVSFFSVMKIVIMSN
jgi:hypothetical protein